MTRAAGSSRKPTTTRLGLEASCPQIFGMPGHVALLRAVNLGPHNKISMADVRAVCDKAGLEDARTLLQSGNVVFRASGRDGAALERLLETETEKRLGLKTEYFVRTAEEWEGAIARNPFPKEAKSDPSHLVVVFLKAAPDAASVKALQAAISGPELVRVVGRQAYITYPAGIGTSRLTIAIIERKLGTRGTSRNWNTVMKLGALAST